MKDALRKQKLGLHQKSFFRVKVCLICKKTFIRRRCVKPVSDCCSYRCSHLNKNKNIIKNSGEWIIKEYENGTKKTTIAKKLKISISSVETFLKNSNIIIRNDSPHSIITKRLNKEKDLIINQYIIEKKTPMYIAEQFNTTASSIVRYLKDNNVKIRNRIEAWCPERRRNIIIKHCKICHKILTKKQEKYCSHKCQTIGQSKCQS